ncbi:PaaI family thioesterase [Sinimarinibacterium thermocellulolyticum]|uniref:PaaI family thioesterase n=1 Tax=Sinimarinibacterium thermocellulolyticum TaxID=3170016 RepID=A0ABV2AAA4_9GAMM
MDSAALSAAGWRSIEGRGFTAQLGPIWVLGGAGERQIGFIATAQQGNDQAGAVHGGALMTFADIALGYAAADALGGSHLVTAQLQVHFVSGGRVGEFIHCRPELVRRSTHLIFVRGLLVAGARTLASADGIWKVLDQAQARGGGCSRADTAG